jgi:hypothetical protein
MIRFRTWLCAASAACGLILGSGAQAQITSIILPSGGCVVSGSTLDCSGGGSGTASCTISGPSTVIPGIQSTYTGSCRTAAGAADSITGWTGCDSSNGSTCLLSQANTITVTGAAGGTASKTVSAGSASCSISPSNPTVQLGDSQTFSVSCNFTPTAWSWTGLCTGSQATCTTSPTSSGSVSVTASKGQTSASDSTNVNVSTGGGGGGTVPTTCDDGKQSVVAKTANVFNGLPISVSITDSQVAVFPIVAPAAGKAAQLVFFETGDPFSDKVPRNMWASKTPCYTPAAQRRFGLSSSPSAQVAYQVGGGGTLNMNTVGGSIVSFPSGFPLINAAPGETWYVMVENAVAGQCKQANSKGACNISLTPNPAN